MRVLLIDDSKVMRTIVRTTLAEFDLDIVEAENGAEALEVVASGPLPDLILVDWHMPVMDGLEFIREFRKSPAHAPARVLMVTTVNDVEKVQDALEAGANEYLMKPFTKDALVDKIQMLGIQLVGSGA